jgi:hypothetical protein
MKAFSRSLGASSITGMVYVVGFVGVVGANGLGGRAAAAEAAPAAPDHARIASAYGKLPLSFEANVGQVDGAVDFLCRGPGSTLFLSRGEAVLSLGSARQPAAVVRLRLAGNARHPRGRGLGPQLTTSNYLVGGDPRRWHRGIAHYTRVLYPGVYPGIDLAYHGEQRQLEHDFLVAPGADPASIRLAFDGAPALGAGAATIAIGAGGELIVHTAQGDLVQPPPVVYQEAAGSGRREPVRGRYVLRASSGGGRPRGLGHPDGLERTDEIERQDGFGRQQGIGRQDEIERRDGIGRREGFGRREVGFEIGRYDRSRRLIIDPRLPVYSTFLGGFDLSAAYGIAVDAAGNAYVTGVTDSPNFPGVTGGSIQPAAGGGLDAFVTKINAAGTAIVYSTYLGGSDDDYGFGIAVDGAGSAYVTGYTESTSFPGVTAGSIQPASGGGYDAFVAKLDPAGDAIVYATFLGGAGDDYGYRVAVDAAGDAYVTGNTNSTSFPGVTGSSIQPANAGGIDAFVTKLDPAGTTILYSTFLGGTGDDFGYDIAVDGTGSAYVAGATYSTTFPGVTGGSIQPANAGQDDAFVTKLDAAGTAIVYSTFLGGNQEDFAYGIAVDAAGDAYVTGATESPTFPGVTASSLQPAPGGSFDAFVAKLDAAGRSLVYSTFLGGTGSDVGVGIAVDAAGNAYVTGFTSSSSFPGVGAGSIQPFHAGGTFDAFAAKIDAAGSAIVYATYLGGSGNDWGFHIAVDRLGNAYVVGPTNSLSFTGVTAGSLQPVGDGDTGFVTKIGATLSLYTVAPCRVFDTRDGSPMSANETRLFQVSGNCGVPAGAISVSANLTVVQPQAAGALTAFPGDAAQPPDLGTLSFAAGQVRANNAMLLLAGDGSGTIKILASLPQGTTGVLLDVNGYFQ